MALSHGQPEFPYSCSDQSALFIAWEHNRIKQNGIQKCGYLGLKNLILIQMDFDESNCFFLASYAIGPFTIDLTYFDSRSY